MPTTRINLKQYSQSCKISVLKKMGWNFSENSAMPPQVESPNVCISSTNAELSSQLKINYPQDSLKLSNFDMSSILEEAFWSVGTQCSFQNFYAQSLEKATHKLKKKHLYLFAPFWIKDNLKLGTMKKLWQRQSCPGEVCFLPTAGKSSEAISALDKSLFSSDCAIGLQLAEYATVKDLFGSEKFNQFFSNDEVFVGDWSNIIKSNSFTHGINSQRIQPQNGLSYARSGYRTFVGVTGYIGSVYEESFLDDKPNRNENFIIVKNTANAAETFLTNGGLEFYNEYMLKIWQQTKNITPEELSAMEYIAQQGKLAKMTLIDLQRLMPQESNIIVNDESAEIAKKLTDSFLNETQIYVHPFGLKSISWHILHLARINSRTPYSLVFYKDATHSEVYDRWIKMQLDSCK